MNQSYLNVFFFNCWIDKLFMNSLAQSDLKISIEELAPEGDTGYEHGEAHEADSLAVHQEPVRVGSWQVVAGASCHNPGTHFIPEKFIKNNCFSMRKSYFKSTILI